MRLAVGTFSDRLDVTLIGVSRLIRVSFEHQDPNRAALIVNSLTQEFISKDLERKTGSTRAARDFLEDRIRIVKSSLERSERSLARYASDNNIIIIENDREQGQEATSSLDKIALVTLDADLTQANTERLIAEQNYLSAKTNPLNTNILADSALNELKAELTMLETEYSEKLEIYYPEFPDMIELQSKIDIVSAKISAKTEQILETNLAELKASFDLSKAKASNLYARVDSLKNSVVDLRDKRVDYNILKRQLDTERAQYDGLLQRLKEISVSDDIGDSLVQLVDKAEPPRLPFKPNKMLVLLLAFILSVFVAIGGAAVIELIDDRIKTPDDITKKLSSIIMGVIPEIKMGTNPVEMLQSSISTIAEAYASVRTNLQFSGADGGPRVIQITSTRPGEGKSVSSLGLAMRYAGIGKRVLLIDADLRLPTFIGGSGDSIGLSGLLTTREKLEDHIGTADFENLSFLTSGAIVPNPSEILSGERMVELLSGAKATFDYVIVDSPPVLGIADALILGALVDATLLIVECKAVRTPAIKFTMERLQKSGTKLLGVVLTKYDVSGQGYFDYYKYSYGADAGTYGQKDKGKKSKAAKKKHKLEII